MTRTINWTLSNGKKAPEHARLFRSDATPCRNCGERPATGRLFCDECRDEFPALEDVEEFGLEDEIF